MVKGIILCGGTASRLGVLSRITNKHLLPVYSKPMIFYPIQWMVDSGIRDIMLVTGGNHAGEFLRLIGNGAEFGLKHVAYTYQHEPKGIADALSLAEEWVDKEPICVMLGDNIIEKPLPEVVNRFQENPNGARIFLTQVDHPEHYGVVELERGCRFSDPAPSLELKVNRIVEKPKNPKSNFIAIGLYMYDSTVWDYIGSLSLSSRQELEITDLNNKYLKTGKLHAHLLGCKWADCGESVDGYMDACVMVRDMKNISS
jgi:glucose-1-phosphate thymidylyltransferase